MSQTTAPVKGGSTGSAPRRWRRRPQRARLVAALVLACLAFGASRGTQGQPHRSDDAPLHFAVIADPHVGRSRDTGLLKRTLRYLARTRPAPDLVVVLGDLTDSFRDRDALQYRKLMSGLPLPVLDVPGNHDVGFRPTARRMDRYYRVMEQSRLPSVSSYKGRHFVAFNSQWFSARRRRPEPGDEGLEHMDRLEQLVAGLPPGPIFLVHHIPSVPNFVKLKAKATWHEVFQERYGALLETYPVAAIFAGHFHRDELHFVRGVPLFVCPPVSGKYRVTPSFRIVHHDRRGIRYRQIYLENHGTQSGYQRDLRGLTETDVRSEILELDGEELEHLVRRRYAGTGLGVRRLVRLRPALLKEILLGPPAGSSYR